MTGSHKPRKRFGQHFLHDPNVIDRIIAGFAPRPDDHVVEIGPGQGALTDKLAERCGRLDIIELDRDLVTMLASQFGSYPDLHVHQADALKFDFCGELHKEKPLRVIGNLPYNISTPLLFHLLDQSSCIRDMCFMLQKEVIDRMLAVPRTKAYGRLSVMMQLRCQMTRLFDIGPGAFNPPPKVWSSVIRIIPHDQPPYPVASYRLMEEVVRQAFEQRRKTLRNALSGLVNAEMIFSCGIDPALRPDQLEVSQYVALVNALYASREPHSAET